GELFSASRYNGNSARTVIERQQRTQRGSNSSNGGGLIALGRNHRGNNGQKTKEPSSLHRSCVSFALFLSPLSPNIIDLYYWHTALRRFFRSAHQHRPFSFSLSTKHSSSKRDKGSSSESVRGVGSPGGDEQIRERRKSLRKREMKKRKEEEIEMRKKEREMRESGGDKGRQVLSWRIQVAQRASSQRARLERSVQLGSGLVAFQSQLLRSCNITPLSGKEERKGRRAFFVWLCLKSVPDGRDQWGPLVLTLSNSTCCILTAVLSLHLISHSPVARHRNQIHHKECLCFPLYKSKLPLEHPLKPV
ncbi:hypothetical protein ALC62_07256, partial [Cyphomyrmex costatus]